MAEEDVRMNDKSEDWRTESAVTKNLMDVDMDFILKDMFSISLSFSYLLLGMMST